MNKILTEHLKSWRADRPDEWTMDGFIKKALALEQENAKLKGALETIIDEAGCCTGEDALNMLRTAEHAIKSITGGE